MFHCHQLPLSPIFTGCSFSSWAMAVCVCELVMTAEVSCCRLVSAVLRAGSLLLRGISASCRAVSCFCRVVSFKLRVVYAFCRTVSWVLALSVAVLHASVCFLDSAAASVAGFISSALSLSVRSAKRRRMPLGIPRFSL